MGDDVSEVTPREARFLVRGGYAEEYGDNFGSLLEITNKGRSYFEQLEDKLYN